MAAYKGNIHRDIKTLFTGKIKSLHQPFGMNVLCTEKEILSFFKDMHYVIISTVSPVPDKHGFMSRNSHITVNHGAESPVFILKMDRLDEGVRISMPLKVVKGIQVHAVKALCRMSP